MLRWIKFSLALALGFGLVACETLDTRKSLSAEEKDSAKLIASNVMIEGYGYKPSSIMIDGQMASLYMRRDGRVVFSHGAQTQLLDEGALGNIGGSVTLSKSGNHIYAFWWNKVGKKSLYSRVSHDGGKTFGQLNIINSAHGILPPYSVVIEENGTVGVVYHDERESDSYQVYFNRSQDFGDHWGANDVRIDRVAVGPVIAKKKKGSYALDPKIASDGKNWVITWIERVNTGQGSYHVMSVSSSDRGKTWAPAVEIYSGTDAPSGFRLLGTDNRFFLVGNIEGSGVVAYQTVNGGKSWQAAGGLFGTQGLINGQISLAYLAPRLHVAFVGKKQDVRNQVYRGMLSSEDGKWLDEARQVAPNIFDQNQTMLPNLGIVKDKVLLVWEDYRNIRPNLYLTYSSDNGETWVHDIALEEEGRHISFFPEIGVEEDRAYVYFQRNSSEAKETRNYYGLELAFEKNGKVKDFPLNITTLSADEKRNLLADRVRSFWQYRVDGKFAETFKYYDPAYRISISQEDFVKFQGNLKYYQYDVQNLDIKGNVAKVRVATNFEVMETIIMGEKFSKPPMDDVQTTEWVWIYDNWYLVHKSAFGNQELQY